MWLTFLVSLVAMTMLFYTLYRFELTTKHARARMNSLRRQLLNDDSPVLRRSAAPTL